MRRKIKIKHTLKPDPVYDSILIEKFTNYLMKQGKKTLIRRLVYKALDDIKRKIKTDPVAIFEKAIDNVSPQIAVRSRRVGGATYQVPKEIPAEKRAGIAMKWIIQAAQAKKGKNIVNRLTDELLLASKGEGAAIKKRDDTHKMAEANRAFAHFSW